MTIATRSVDVTLGFLPASFAIADPEHPGFLRAGERASAPYGGESVEFHVCSATDGLDADAPSPDLLEMGFDVADLSGFAELQDALAHVREAGRLDDAEADAIRSMLEGAVLPLAGGHRVKVLHLAGEGFIMRTGGPNRLRVVGERSQGMNDHGVATSVHGDQDVYGTPLKQLMEGRAPELLRHDSPDGRNEDSSLLLVNLWIPLQQVTQPLVLADGRTIDRPRHQLRYGLATEEFLDRDEDQVINDIWNFLHDPAQRWYLRSQMDHRSAYVFNTLSTAHGAGTLAGEGVAERCYLALEAAEDAVEAGDVDALVAVVASVLPIGTSGVATPALTSAIEAMAAVLEAAERDPGAVCGPSAATWLVAARQARKGVIRMSLELRMVVSVEPPSINAS